MTDEQQLKLQAFFDGELPESDAREVSAWLAQDADATGLLTELKNTRHALKVSEPQVKLPESREFYWSKIKREIERTAAAPAPVPRASLFTWVRRALVPLGAVAMLVIAGFIMFHQPTGGQKAVAVNSMLADAGAFTYRDEAQGMTVVWLSYPAENKFAQKSSSDTLSPK
jgi:anti-sigma factor RsiW